MDEKRELDAAREQLRRDAQAIAQLAEVEIRYFELFNLASDAIFTSLADTGAIIDANRKAEALTGYSREELLNLKMSDLESDVERPGSPPRGGPGNATDRTFVTKDGRHIIVSVSRSFLDFGGRRVANHICRDMTRERELEAQLATHTRTLEMACIQKTEELLESQKQLLQTEKMASLGSLFAGLAHEINTPLGAINGNNDVIALAFKKVEEYANSLSAAASADAHKDIVEVLDIVSEAIRTNRLACDRLVKIVRNVRMFARLEEAERKKSSIHDGIENTLTLLAHELRGRAKVIREFGEIPEIEVYPNALNQVIMNLLVNAVQAIERDDGSGEIRIRTSVEDDSVRIAITDNGKGIPPEVRTRIFDPGFTTKRAGLGTGLGLSICLKIVQKHGGRIELASEVGQGTTFTIVLPIQESVRKEVQCSR